MGTRIDPISHLSLLRWFFLFLTLSDVIIVLVYMCWRYLIVFILGFVIFFYYWDTWVPLKNWIPLGHLWMLLLVGQVFYFIYELIIDGHFYSYESVELFHSGYWHKIIPAPFFFWYQCDRPYRSLFCIVGSAYVYLFICSKCDLQCILIWIWGP